MKTAFLCSLTLVLRCHLVSLTYTKSHFHGMEYTTPFCLSVSRGSLTLVWMVVGEQKTVLIASFRQALAMCVETDQCLDIFGFCWGGGLLLFSWHGGLSVEDTRYILLWWDIHCVQTPPEGGLTHHEGSSIAADLIHVIDGFPLSPVVANLYMEHFQHLTLTTTPMKPKMWKYYVYVHREFKCERIISWFSVAR